MKFKELEKKSVQELMDLIDDLKAELFTLRFKNKTQQQDQTHKIKLVRRDIAKALTAINQKKPSEQKTNSDNKNIKATQKQENKGDK